MLEKPDLAENLIIQGLRTTYNLDVSTLEFLPIGYDASAWVYQVQTVDAQRYFLKLKKGPVAAAALRIPDYMQRQGAIDAVVAPLPGLDGAFHQPLTGAFSLILYPFLTGENGMAAGLSEPQWMALGQALRQIHAIRLPADLLGLLRIESYRPPQRWLEVIATVQRRIDAGQLTTTFEQALADIWRQQQADITHVMAQITLLGNQLRALQPVQVVCHADIHTANVIAGPQDCVHIVDWDGILLAPPERDLMFIDAHNAAFALGYGGFDPNPLTIAYYRYEWVVQEFADYAERVFFMDTDIGDVTRQAAVAEFAQLFLPDDVVAAARQSAHHLAG